MKKLSWYYKSFIFKLKSKIDLDKKNEIKNKSLDEIFNFFGSDKGTAVRNPYGKNSKKVIGHGFGKFYEKHFKKLKKKNFNFLEIGTWEGASLASFHNYFNRAQIYGIDRNFKNKYFSKRLKFLYCDTTNLEDLKIIKKNFNKKKFKIIIDDGSHLLKDIIHNLKFFFQFLDYGGYYVIEDYNHPKYYKFLNNSNNQEILVDKIIDNLRKKKNFKSKILNNKDQQKLFKNIKKIYTYKGIMIDANKNVSDILILKKTGL